MNVASRFKKYLRIIRKDLENDRVPEYNKPNPREVFATSIGFLAGHWDQLYEKYKSCLDKVRKFYMVGDYMVVFLLENNDIIVLEANDLTGLVHFHDTIVSP
jgi:hypothetical protein